MSYGLPQRDRAQDVKHGQSALPRLHEVLGDVLERPATKPRRSHNCYNDNNTQRVSSLFYASTSGVAAARPRLPPIQPAMSPKAEWHSPPPSYMPSTRDDSKGYQVGHSMPSRDSAREHNRDTSRSPAHSYDVFLLTSEQQLSHKRSSMRDDHTDVTKEIAISGSSGKYLCKECGRRFQKNSTLKNHLTTHSGERPYECPDCRRTFSVSSNMKRHLERVHRSEAAIAYSASQSATALNMHRPVSSSSASHDQERESIVWK